MISIRPAALEDWGFVIGTWLDSFRDEPEAGMVSMESWYPSMEPELKKLLNRKASRTLVACGDDDPSFLYGFICGEPSQPVPLVHYVFVKQPYRRWKDKPGIASRLFAALGVDPRTPFDYTYSTFMVRRLESKIPLARWQRMLARFPPGHGIRR